jgi:hypothetical protein
MSVFEFESGREAGIKWGERFERERIIKLLDNLHEEFGQTAHITNRSSVCKTCRAIERIKGENK